MGPNPAPIGTGSFISHQRILDPPEITIFARSSITRGRTGGEGQGIIMTVVLMGMMVVMQRREMVVIIHQERFSGPEREDRGRWDRREGREDPRGAEG